MPKRRGKIEAQDDPFIFIDYAKPATKPGKRRIRIQAMRAVARNRKELGTYGKHNLGQFPVFDESAVGFKVYSCISEDPKQCLEVTPRSQRDLEFRIPRTMSAQGYEAAKISCNFDIFSLSALTSFHFSKASAKLLRADVARLKNLLRLKRQTSYLDYVPELYCDDPLIGPLVDITLARARQTVTGSSSKPEPEVLAVYGSALLYLQAALEDPVRRFEPSVLCATHLLALYELLDFSDTSLWEHHISGAIQLTELRGAGRYTTEFERSLLASTLGTIFSETTLKNTDCFLDEPEWRNTLVSLGLTLDTDMERHPLLLELWRIAVPISRLFRRITRLILASDTYQPSEVVDLSLRCYHIRYGIKKWRVDINQAIERCEESSQLHRRFLQSVALSMSAQCIVQRLLVALQPHGEDAYEMEVETQELSHKILDMAQDMINEENPQPDILLAQKSAIARAMIATAEDWLREVQGIGLSFERGRSPIKKEVFRKWSDTLGRRID